MGKKLFRLLCVVLAAILVGLLALYFLANALLDKINKLDPDQTYAQDPEAIWAGHETDPVNDRAETIFKGEDIVNILLVGQDSHADEEDSVRYTDAMLMCTINKKTGTFTMTSFMPDLWVYVPERYNQPLNSPYMLGGFPLLNKTLDYNFGISADYNVLIDYSGFMKIVDAFGGVEINLTDAEAKYLNIRGNWDIEENQNWSLKEGSNVLTGSQALAYSRIRQIGTEIGRTNRQRTVLTALIADAGNIGSAKLFDLTRELVPLIYTDMTNEQILRLIVELLPALSNFHMVSQCIPMEGQYEFAQKEGVDVVVMDGNQMKANKELLSVTMGGQ